MDRTPRLRTPRLAWQSQRRFGGSRPGSASGRSVSRILSGESRRFTPRGFHPCSLASAIISLCSLPETLEERAAPSSLFDLAPDGGCLAARIAADAGGLLHHLFTIAAFGTAMPLARQFLSVARSDRLFRPGISPAPCPAEYGLSSTPHVGKPRSPDRPEATASYTGGSRASTADGSCRPLAGTTPLRDHRSHRSSDSDIDQ